MGDGQWAFSDRTARPTIDDVAHATAIHGLVRWRPFRIDSVNQNRCSLTLLLHPSPEYPFLSEINVTYHLGRLGLTVTTTVTNRDDVPIPSAWLPSLPRGHDTNDRRGRVGDPGQGVRRAERSPTTDR